jgi:hypothetical protein
LHPFRIFVYWIVSCNLKLWTISSLIINLPPDRPLKVSANNFKLKNILYAFLSTYALLLHTCNLSLTGQLEVDINVKIKNLEAKQANIQRTLREQQ